MSAAEAPSEFVQALHALRDTRLRSEVRLSEVPAPTRIAPYAVALQAEVIKGHDEVGSGRFVLLHDPAAPEAWEGTFRVVTLTRANLESDLEDDPLLAEGAWSWVTETLDAVPHHALGGTVTRVVSQSFGELASRSDDIEIEIRASWTPDCSAGEQLSAWATVLCTAAGLPPVPPGVTPLPRFR
jgi:hypothetical protein